MIPAAYVVLERIRHLEKDWFVFGGLFVLSLAIFIADKFAGGRVHEFRALPDNLTKVLELSKKESRQTTEATKFVPAQPKRMFVRDSITPEYLCDLFRGRTEVQAQKLFEPFKGQWIKIQGKVINVNDSVRDSGFSLSLRVTLANDNTKGSRESRKSPVLGIALSFNPEWNQRLSAIPRMDEISAIGRIDDFKFDVLFLEDCELVD